VKRKGVKKSLPVIISPEIEAVIARGILSAITIKPFVVPRSLSVTNSICKVEFIGPAMFIKAVRLMYAVEARAKFGDKVMSMMKGMERYWQITMLLTLPNLFDNTGATRVPMPNVTLLKAEIMPICSVLAKNFSLKNRLKRGTMNPAPKPMKAVGIINLSIIR